MSALTPTIGCKRVSPDKVDIVPYVQLAGVDADCAYFEHVTSGQPVILESMDTLVFNHASKRRRR